MEMRRAYKIVSKSYDLHRDKSPYFRIIEGITKRAIYENTEVNNKIRVLDIGCGTGRNIDIFLSQGATVYGIDYSPDMLNIAKEKYRNNSKVKLFIGNAEKLPFKDSFFDVVCSFKTLPHVHNLAKAIKEVRRVTKKRGKILLEFYSPYSFKRIFNRYYYYTKWHSVSEASRLIKKSGLRINKIYGSRAFIIAEPICYVPLFNRVLNLLENYFTNTWLNRLSGYYIIVCTKP
jgi:ubiquinone/menaquinone biosynthesis C-methylase UbiE